MIRCTAVLITLVLTSVAFAQQSVDREVRLKQLLEQFPKADANDDGTLTVEEARAFLQARRAQKDRRKNLRPRVEPTRADIRYGEHERNVFDLYLPEKRIAEPTPVYVYFHGGGFVGGDKRGFDAAPYLEAGYAVVSGNYRLVDGKTTLSPAPLVDAARVIQYVRGHANEWKLDPNRIAVSGSSAGAVIALFIGYHDDLADPESEDPIARNSSRVRCIVPMNGPTNLDPQWVNRTMGGPEHVHGSFPKLFGTTVDQFDRPEIAARVREISAVDLASADDPPTFLIYSGANEGIPLPATATTGRLIHHAYFGEHLKKTLDRLGVTNRYATETDPRGAGSKVVIDWLETHLLGRE